VHLVSTFLVFVQALSPAFTSPSHQSFVTLLTGWVMAQRRTVTGMIVAADAVGTKHHSAFHRFFASARWSLDTLGLCVFDLIEPICPAGSILLAGDDTLARKRGLKLFGVGMHHDPLQSSRNTVVTSWGHSWVILAVVVQFPFRPGFAFALPVLLRLYRSKQTVQREGGDYFTKPQLMVQMLRTLCAHRSNRRFHLVADSTYGGKSVLCHLPDNCDLTSRLLMDARLHAKAPTIRSPKGGRPHRRGARLPNPTDMLKGRTRDLTLKIYGRRDRSRVAECVAYHYNAPERLLKVVAVHPRAGGRTPQAFFSTCADASARDVLHWYAMRWSLECTHRDAKQSLGFEHPQGWTRRAALRTAPMAMLLYSLVVLWFAKEGHRHCRPIHRPWYVGKRHASFAEMLATLRQKSLEQVLKHPGKTRVSQNPVRFLLRTLKTAG